MVFILIVNICKLIELLFMLLLIYSRSTEKINSRRKCCYLVPTTYKKYMCILKFSC